MILIPNIINKLNNFLEETKHMTPEEKIEDEFNCFDETDFMDGEYSDSEQDQKALREVEGQEKERFFK